MALLQIRIRDAQEAATAAAASIDSVELVVEDGVAADLAKARDVRRCFPGLLRLRLNGAGLPRALLAEIANIADELAADAAALATLADDIPRGLRRVAIVAPGNAADAISQTDTTVNAVMLEADAAERLIDRSPIAKLDAFASACRERRLGFGLGGGLEAPDVARLLLLEPDVLAFDGAVRQDHRPDGPLDPQALDAIRALVPRGTKGDAKTIARVTDRIFVRDFEISLAIGAYQAEQGRRQRVRFGTVAEVNRTARPPHDMRDVFSYDIMIETIRVLSERPHVTFVETLAEEVAAAVLAHAEVVAVTVTVEKLDVINGSVGIEITRRRDA